jgi:hypothetical protein
MDKIKTRQILYTLDYFDACTVKGFFLDKYASIRELSTEINKTVDGYSVKIDAFDKFDRTIDFQRSHETLHRAGKCLT